MKRVLAVGMFDSVHFSRWLGQFRDQPIEFQLFPSSPHRGLHPKLAELIEGTSTAKYSLGRFSRFTGVPLWILDKALGNGLRGYLIIRAIRRFRPHIIHALELQNAGYIALRALERGKPEQLRLVVTNYGSDIYWYSKFPSHLAKIKRLLAITDQYACECERDIQLVRHLGFKGEVMPVRPNAGGFSKYVLERELVPASGRRTIAIKGYQGWAGRASLAIEALYRLQVALKDHEIIFYSCNMVTSLMARRCGRSTGLQIKTYGKGALSHSEMLDLFGESLLYVGLSVSDGISTSMLEAMAMGAIPVQTSTACCDEWFEQTGVKVEELSVEIVADAILKGLDLARDPSNRITNRETIRSKASEEYVKDAALGFYR